MTFLGLPGLKFRGIISSFSIGNPVFEFDSTKYFSTNLQKYEYQEQKAEVEVIGADGSIFVSISFEIKNKK